MQLSDDKTVHRGGLSAHPHLCDRRSHKKKERSPRDRTLFLSGGAIVIAPYGLHEFYTL